jgi:hypothetical protein
LPYKNNF